MVLAPPPTFGTPITDPGQEGFKKLQEEQEKKDKKECQLRGGKWDSVNKICVGAKLLAPDFQEPKSIDLVQPKKEKQNVKLTPEQRENIPKGSFVKTDRFGNETIVTKEEREEARSLAEFRIASKQGPTTSVEDLEQRDIARQEGRELAGQIGQFGQLGVSPTDLDWGEAATTAAISSIPSAIRLGATAGLGIGALGGTAVFPGVGTAIGATAGAAIGAGAGFIAGIVGGMTSNFKSQRSDTTTAQQRVLDEGKQTLQDWVTLASSDPANRVFYLAQYNKQLAQIDQAHRQMKLDTSRDLAKFETAIPNLAEFDSFYSVGGERDALNEDMRNALLTMSPENYNMLELAHRRQQ